MIRRPCSIACHLPSAPDMPRRWRQILVTIESTKLNLRATFLLATLACLVVAKASGSESGLLDVKNGRLYYEVTGKGPPLIFIHGGLTDHRLWDEDEGRTFP